MITCHDGFYKIKSEQARTILPAYIYICILVHLFFYHACTRPISKIFKLTKYNL